MERAFERQATVRPSDAARQAAMRAATEAFEQENANVHQGSSIGSRLRERGNQLLIALKRRPFMDFAHPKLTHLLAGGASLAVLAVAVVSIDHIRPGIVSTPVETKLGQATPADEKDVIAALPDSAPVARLEEEVPKTKEAGKQQPGIPPVSKRENRAQFSFSPQTTGGVVANEATSGLRSRDDTVVRQYRDQGRDKFSDITSNPLKVVAKDPVSTFSIDVDTASYAFVRNALNNGVLPQKDAVRVEEMINYFDYGYQAPENRNQPFRANVSVMPTPWNTNTKLLRIGIKGFELPKTEAPKANLVFLIDTSGSMNAPDKLPLLRNSFKLLLSSLKPDDTVSIVTYAGSAGTVLEPTRVADRNKILSALERLNAGGSTAGAEGIRQAYQLAERQIDNAGVNRVILATDGDFNVGISDTGELKSFIERKRASGVTLSVLGFGRGNYNDELMQALAQNGNGNAAYIDTLSEARKVLVEEAGSTLFTIAKDVKLQLEFNPATVSEYRLIGYETRLLNREDFNNDKVDAGDIGAGHTVTALYEITPVGANGRLVDDLRYQSEPAKPATGSAEEYAFIKIRYKLPDSDTSTLITAPVTRVSEAASVAKASRDDRFAASVAAFGQVLSGGRYTGSFSYDDVVSLAQSTKGEDRFGYRAEFINLVRLAKSAAALEPGEQ
ncbi:MAG: VWA domain-containing protein [Anderseniella sp.]|nr:VWA domain-containing protein [Anderseniella sp.]